jgi:DNA-binding NarL/FixJ family response regulator
MMEFILIPKPQPPPRPLSPQLTRVYEMAVAGMQNKEIAAAMNITERTVKFHVSKLLEIFGVQARYELQSGMFVDALRHADPGTSIDG